MENSSQRQAIVSTLFEDMGAVQRLLVPSYLPGIQKGLPSRAQMALLFSLAREGSRSLKEIAETFHMTSSAATQLVDGLEFEKLLTRAEDFDDRRKIIVSLTPKGRIKLEDTKNARLAALTALLETLSDEELAQLVRLQKKILHAHVPHDRAPAQHH